MRTGHPGELSVDRVIDLNCDLGEGEPLAKTRALMQHITSANIACGGHAGDGESMRACLRLCRELGVRAGAHPGLCDRENFGRVERALTPAEFRELVAEQVEALSVIAQEEGVALTHLKLHGALYHMVEKDAGLAKALIGFVRESRPELEIYGVPGGRIDGLAQKNGISFRGEVFADRAYTAQGLLMARSETGAVLTDLDAIAGRIREWIRSGEMVAIDGANFFLPGDTICVHSDSPRAVEVAERLGSLIRS